jgi:dipeptidyl aminopeptidase/acylaminoacyl peptidase
MAPDLVADYLNSRPADPDSHVGVYEQGQGNMHGTPWDQQERYLANSPIYSFDRIATPLLIGQGDMDFTMQGMQGGNLLAADMTFAALKRLGKPVEYRIYKNEGHVLSRKANVVDFWERRLSFLAENLSLTTTASGSAKSVAR